MSFSGISQRFGKLELSIVMAIAVAFLFQLYLAFTQEINWDEFFCPRLRTH